MSRIQAIDTSVDALVALLWQHDNAVKLKTLITLKQQWYARKQDEFWTDWFRDVFDIDTANSFGLNVWARILDIPLYVTLQPDTAKVAFGFGTSNANFNNGNFGSIVPQNSNLQPEQARLVLKLRYAQLTSRPTAPEVNRLLARLFPNNGLVYVGDGLNMTCTYFFQYAPDSQVSFVLDNFDVLPRPAGVKSNWIVQPREAFGFTELHYNFDNGSFGA